MFGAGAIGGLIAARHALTGTPVSIVARGAHLAAIEQRGLTLRVGDDEQRVWVDAARDGSAFGPQDYVIVAVKAHALPTALPALVPLVDSRTVVVPAMNGVPWWFFDGFGGTLENMHFDEADRRGDRCRARVGVCRLSDCMSARTRCHRAHGALGSLSW